MPFTFQTAKMLVTDLKTKGKTEVTRAELSKLLREITNTMDPRWIKNFMQSMVTAGLLEVLPNANFKVI